MTNAEAEARAAKQGPGLESHAKRQVLPLPLVQFKSPIIILLLEAAILPFFLGDVIEGTIILVIVAISGLLGFFPEHSAANAVERLLSLVKVEVKVLRDGAEVKIPVASVVPGDIVNLSAGSALPADCLLLTATDLHVDEASLMVAATWGDAGFRWTAKMLGHCEKTGMTAIRSRYDSDTTPIRFRNDSDTTPISVQQDREKLAYQGGEDTEDHGGSASRLPDPFVYGVGCNFGHIGRTSMQVRRRQL
ncbi:MAG: magnesium-transporting P-type ATPase [Firmicutes bacterium]|nr:magnesium-transporting P-type ATPase [Bacillota bacterium]